MFGKQSATDGQTDGCLASIYACSYTDTKVVPSAELLGDSWKTDCTADLQTDRLYIEWFTDLE
jgi:hypothetical protein